MCSDETTTPRPVRTWHVYHPSVMRSALLFLALFLGSSASAGPDDRPSGKLRLALTGTIETLDPAKVPSGTSAATTMPSTCRGR